MLEKKPIGHWSFSIGHFPFMNLTQTTEPGMADEIAEKNGK
jgi:hypothetical protein